MEIYTNGNGIICGRQPIDTETYILLQASNLRRQSTGLHATITLTLYHRDVQHDLDDDTFNIKRREDRQRLAFAAHRYLESLAVPSCEKESLKHGLDVFCRRLEDEWLKQFTPVLSEGKPASPLEFWLKPYIPKYSGVVLFAPPGRGKSFTGQIWAQCIHYDMPLIWPVNQARVLFINLERSRDSVERRLGQVNRALNLNEDAPIWMQHARGKTLEVVYSAAKRLIDSEGIELVFVDSMSRSGIGNLNDNDVANSIMDMMNSLCPSWVLLAHTPRNDETHSFGSIMTDAAADVTIQLLTQEKESSLGIGFQIDKRNDMPKQPLQIIALDFDALGLADVRRASPHEFTQIEAGQKKDLGDEIYNYLLDSGKESATTIARSLGKEGDRANISRILSVDPRFVNLGRDGHSVLYGAKAF